MHVVIGEGLVAGGRTARRESDDDLTSEAFVGKRQRGGGASGSSRGPPRWGGVLGSGPTFRSASRSETLPTSWRFGLGFDPRASERERLSELGVRVSGRSHR